MDRKKEYFNLLSELENEPAFLEHTVTHARARSKKATLTRSLFTIPTGCLMIFFIVFILMVNVSATFAIACGRIPLIKELAAAVSFSPSLSAAVKNEYVQPIELEQNVNEITMRVEYVIVDQKQLNIFYSLNSKVYSAMDATPSILSTDREAFESYSIYSGSYNVKNEDLRQFTIDFMYADIPESLILICNVHDNGSYQNNSSPPAPVQVDLFSPVEHKEPDYIAEFEFILNFDPMYTQQGDIITLNHEFILDGQYLTAETVEIYPTHIRLNLEDAESNTAWLKSLGFYLEDDKGNRFEAIGNGITATGSIDSPMMKSHRLESSYFSHNAGLTLKITEVSWLDKDMEQVEIDLVNSVCDTLPQGVVLEQASLSDNGWILTFSAPYIGDNCSYHPFSTIYYDESGNEYEYNAWSSGMSGYTNEDTGEYTERSDEYFIVQFALPGYFNDTVRLSPSYSRRVTLETPAVITVR